MKKDRQVPRLPFENHQNTPAIARNLGISRDTVSDISTSIVAGMSWPLPDGLDDIGLESRLSPLASADDVKIKPVSTRATEHHALKQNWPSSAKKPKTAHPTRQLIKSSPHRTTGGAYIEDLTPYPAEHESAYEKLAIPVLALCHDVKQIKSQNKRTTYPDANGVERSYTADFAVERESKDLLLEVKSLKFLVQEDEFAKYQEIARHLRICEQPFAFLVDAQLLQQPLRSTANLLFRYVTSTPPDSILLQANKILQAMAVPIHDLCSKANLSLCDVYTLIAKRHLCIDWQAPLNRQSLVSLPDQPFEGLKLERILRSTQHGDLLATLALGRGTPDKRLLADAAAWRQDRRPLAPWNFVAGFSGKPPIRDVGAEELSTGKSWQRRHRAPGQATQPTDA